MALPYFGKIDARWPPCAASAIAVSDPTDTTELKSPTNRTLLPNGVTPCTPTDLVASSF